MSIQSFIVSAGMGAAGVYSAANAVFAFCGMWSLQPKADVWNIISGVVSGSAGGIAGLRGMQETFKNFSMLTAASALVRTAYNNEEQQENNALDNKLGFYAGASLALHFLTKNDIIKIPTSPFMSNLGLVCAGLSTSFVILNQWMDQVDPQDKIVHYDAVGVEAPMLELASMHVDTFEMA